MRRKSRSQIRAGSEGQTSQYYFESGKGRSASAWVWHREVGELVPMNRTGLLIALAVAVGSAVLFAVYPQLDLTIARLFYNQATGRFVLAPVGAAEFFRRAAMWIAWGCAVPAMIAPLIKLFRPDKQLIVPG